MAQFDANIKLLVEAQQAFKKLAQLEDRVDKIKNKAQRITVKSEIAIGKRKDAAAEKQLTNQLRLNAALERRETLLKKYKPRRHSWRKKRKSR